MARVRSGCAKCPPTLHHLGGMKFCLPGKVIKDSLKKKTWIQTKPCTLGEGGRSYGSCNNIDQKRGWSTPLIRAKPEIRIDMHSEPGYACTKKSRHFNI